MFKKTTVPKQLRVFAVLQVLAVVLMLWDQPWGRDGKRVINWDVSIYYTYLPAVFIYQDVGIEQNWPVDFRELKLTFQREYQGRGVLKMSSGMAWLYLPFFFWRMRLHYCTLLFQLQGIQRTTILQWLGRGCFIRFWDYRYCIYF